MRSESEPPWDYTRVRGWGPKHSLKISENSVSRTFFQNLLAVLLISIYTYVLSFIGPSLPEAKHRLFDVKSVEAFRDSLMSTSGTGEYVSIVLGALAVQATLVVAVLIPTSGQSSLRDSDLVIFKTLAGAERMVGFFVGFVGVFVVVSNLHYGAVSGGPVGVLTTLVLLLLSLLGVLLGSIPEPSFRLFWYIRDESLRSGEIIETNLRRVGASRRAWVPLLRILVIVGVVIWIGALLSMEGATFHEKLVVLILGASYIMIAMLVQMIVFNPIYKAMNKLPMVQKGSLVALLVLTILIHSAPILIWWGAASDPESRIYGNFLPSLVFVYLATAAHSWIGAERNRSVWAQRKARKKAIHIRNQLNWKYCEALGQLETLVK